MNSECKAYEDKKKFMQDYVLKRALGSSCGLDGKGAAQEAGKAYDYIEMICKKEDDNK